MAADLVTVQTIFQSIPGIVIGAVIAFAGTLGGVLFTNLGNSKRLALQLKHDKAEKAKERVATLRRELYLKAADTNVRGLAYFGRLPQTDFTKPDSDAPMQNVLAIAAQLQLVVSQDTVQLISDLISAYVELYFRLVVKVGPIHTLRSSIDFCNVQYDNMQTEINRVLAEMTHYNESGQKDLAFFQRLRDSIEFAQGRAQKITDERSDLYAQIFSLQQQYLRDLHHEMKHINELQIHVQVALRRELDIESDIGRFQRTMERQVERLKRALDEFDRSISPPNSTLPCK